ncbi:M17 family metallopeptidase [Mycoplasma procyoni]|uniref:M17 family metallopeptidase n=1 Tax=Mycoplasma procyoni TaxID=568784 RepID=UPI00197B5B4F|nr:M17 family metallopeptidase [Mycoplasma procyoni]MBN3534838.1 M17 family metallopeptidase [Mycoplasma procyoni]
MIKFINNFTNTNVVLKAVFKGEELKKGTIEKNLAITEFLNENLAVIYLGEKEESKTLFETLMPKLASLPRVYDLDLESFLSKKVSAGYFVKKLYEAYEFAHSDIYSAKTSKKEEALELNVVYKDLDQIEVAINKVQKMMEAVNFARNLQATPPNICNSEWMAEEVRKEVSKYPNLKVNVLNKKEIEELGMGLLLSVNRGSMFEPRLVTIEYNGNPASKEKTVFVGKGITFDSGGYNIKTGGHMSGMKYDMSGAAIVASALKAVAELKPKANVAAVLSITDNRVNGDASLPDSVWKSMNGKTVEINNTDAEGRLVLADGMTYAIRNMNATRLITVATLTGAILVALGTTYTGAFSTSNELWSEIQAAAKEQGELVWRLPLHDAFAQNIKKSTVADLKNTDLSGKGGSISAAMFLKEFSENKDFTHLDIAGTAESGEKPMGVMVRTLAQLALNKK